MARPTKYNELKARQITDRLRCAGCNRKDAAGSVGVSEDTFARWLARYADFADQVALAESCAAVRMTTLVTQAATTEWKAALEWLKRRRREEWGDSLNLTKKSDADLIREAGEILKRVGAA